MHCRAYYFGDKTPKADPEYYIRSLQSLHSHFITAVRSADPHMPLIINTCGWLCGKSLRSTGPQMPCVGGYKSTKI